MSNSRLSLANSATSQLLIVDIQEKLANAMDETVLTTLVKNTFRLSEAARLLNIPIIRTEQYPRGLGPTLPMLANIQTHSYLEKTTFSCCTAMGFENSMISESERKQVLIVGMETHICVLQTAAGLKNWGYDVFVVADAVCSRNTYHHANALDRMRHHGIQITNTESVTFEWLSDASHPQFRAISSMFKKRGC